MMDLTEQGLKRGWGAPSDGLDDTGSPEPSSPEPAVLEPAVPEPAIMKSEEQETELGSLAKPPHGSRRIWHQLRENGGSPTRNHNRNRYYFRSVLGWSLNVGFTIYRRTPLIPVANEGAKRRKNCSFAASPAIDKRHWRVRSSRGMQ